MNWNDLDMSQKAQWIKFFVDRNIVDLNDMRFQYNQFAEGGGIHIKPENRGKFTALKERTGHSSTWFKEHGTPAQKKMATFALNASHWKHAYGGPLPKPFSYSPIPTVRYAEGGPMTGIKDVDQGKRSFLEVEEPMWLYSLKTLTTPFFMGPVERQKHYDWNELANRQGWTESKNINTAISPRGAKGLFQIMDGTLQDYQKKTGDIGDIYDPEYNRRVRDYYVNWLMERPAVSSGNPTDEVKAAKAMAAYNWGIGNLGKYMKKQSDAGVDIYNTLDWVDGLPNETKNYVNFIVRGFNTGGHRTNELYSNGLNLK